jgi:hypothetical protein
MKHKVASVDGRNTPLSDGPPAWQEVDVGWIEAIDPDNTPFLRKPVKSTGQRIGVVFRDKPTDNIVIAFDEDPDKVLFCGAAILRLHPRRSARTPRRTAGRKLQP